MRLPLLATVIAQSALRQTLRKVLADLATSTIPFASDLFPALMFEPAMSSLPPRDDLDRRQARIPLSTRHVDRVRVSVFGMSVEAMAIWALVLSLVPSRATLALASFLALLARLAWRVVVAAQAVSVALRAGDDIA